MPDRRQSIFAQRRQPSSNGAVRLLETIEHLDQRDRRHIPVHGDEFLNQPNALFEIVELAPLDLCGDLLGLLQNEAGFRLQLQIFQPLASQLLAKILEGSCRPSPYAGSLPYPWLKRSIVKSEELFNSPADCLGKFDRQQSRGRENMVLDSVHGLS